MPLSDNFFESNSSISRPNTTGATSPYMSSLQTQTDEDGRPILDFLGSALWGATSGITWGASDLAGFGPDKSWEEMSSAEKSGWVLGEGLSLMTPGIGPFALMGKGARAITKLGSKSFTKAGAKKVAQNYTGIADLTAKTTKQIANLGVHKTIKSNIKNSLTNLAKDDTAVGWMQNLKVTGGVQRESFELLSESSGQLVKKAFKDAGVEILDEDALKIGRAFTEEIKDGRFVNDIAEWVESFLVGQAPGAARERVAKYLGMVTQDMAMMSMHGLTVGYMRSITNNTEFHAGEHLSHAAMMSLGFPLIRGIGSGGNASLGQGIQLYLGKYAKANYKAIQAKHGDKVIFNMLRVMSDGSKNGILSRSRLGDAHWTVGKKVFEGSKGIREAIKNGSMTVDDAISVMKQMKVKTLSHIKSQWGPAYREDLLKSLPRMAVGIGAMNPWVFNKDAWNSLEGPEMASHLFVAALMTKSKGAWGRAEKQAYMADFTPYYDALRFLGADVEKVKRMVQFHDYRTSMDGMGAALHTSDAGRRIYDVIETNIKNSKYTAGQDYNDADHRKVANIVALYNLMKAHTHDYNKSPVFERLRIETLDRTTLDNLARELNSIEFGDGITIGKMSYQEVMVRLTLEPAENIGKVYMDMVKDLQNLGYDINVGESGKFIAGRLTSRTSGNDLSNGEVSGAGTVHRILEALDGLGGFGKVTGNKSYVEDAVKRSGLSVKDFQLKTSEIIDKHMDRLAAEYNDKTVWDPVGEGERLNPYFELLTSAKEIQATEEVYKMIFGGGRENTPADNFNKSFDAVFGIAGPKQKGVMNIFASDISKYLKHIDVIKEGSKEWDKLSKTEQEKQRELATSIDVLRNVYELKMLHPANHTAKDHQIKKSPNLTIDNVITLAQEWNKLQGGLPQAFKGTNFQDRVKRLFLERMLGDKVFDQRGYNLLHMLNSTGFARIGNDGEIYIPEKDSFMTEIDKRVGQGDFAKEDVKLFEQSYDNVVKVLGADIVKQAPFMFAKKTGNNMQEFDLNDIVRASKMLGNETFTDFLIKVQPALDRLTVKSDGARKKITELQSRIQLVLHSLDPSKADKPMKDPIGEIEAITKELIELSKNSKLKIHQEDFENATIELDRVIELIDPVSRQLDQMKVGLKQKLSGIDAADPYAVYEAIQEPIQRRLAKIFDRESEAIDRLNLIVNRISNAASAGKSGLGLGKNDALALIDKLTKDMNEIYNGGKSQVSLSKLIEQISETNNFTDSMEILQSVEMLIQKTIITGTEHHPLNGIAFKAAQSLDEGFTHHQHHRSVIDILREWGLVDKENKIDRGFITAVMTNSHNALVQYVRTKIYSSTDKTSSQKASEWKEFRNKDALELIMNIENSRPINRVKLQSIDMSAKQIKTQVLFTPDAPTIDSAGKRFYANKKYKVHFVDDMGSFLSGGKLYNRSLDTIANANEIQNKINEGLKIGTMDEIIKEFKKYDPEITDQMVHDYINRPTDFLFYTRLSPRDKVIFVGSEKNLNKLDADFEVWYKAFSKDLTDKQKKAFDGYFKDVLESKLMEGGDRRQVEIKLLLQYLDGTGKKELLHHWLSSNNSKDMAKFESKMFKVGYLSDGGTTQPLSKSVLDWASKHHPNSDIKKYAKDKIKEGGFKVAAISDEARGAATDILGLTNGQINSQIVGPGAVGFIRDIANAQIKGNDSLESLQASAIDGAEFVSLAHMRLVMATKGRLGEGTLLEGNGAKTIIMAHGDNQMLGKKYTIYHPDVNPADAGVDILLGGSSAKTSYGKGLNGADFQAADISSPDWYKNLGTIIQDNNKMLIPFDSYSVSFTSKTERGVTISASIFDMQSPVMINKAIAWMGFNAKLKEINNMWSTWTQDGGQLANYLFETNEKQGNTLDKGDPGMTKLLLDYGAMPDNPLVYTALKRLLVSDTYMHLRKSSNMKGGEDNFIAPNIKGDLRIPLFVEIHNSSNNLIESGNLVRRSAVQYGGIGLNKHSMLRPLGDFNASQSSLENENFIYRDSNGVDVLIGMDNGKWRSYTALHDHLDSVNSSKDYNAKDTKIVKDVAGTNVYDAFTPKEVKSFKIKSSADQAKVEKVLNNLNHYVQTHDLNMYQAFTLLKNGTLRVVDAKGKGTLITLAGAKKHTIEFASMDHAVPVLGLDKPIHRIQKVLNNMNGLVEVNNHNLRTIMQRDLDGDHLYSHTKIPFDIIKGFARENGAKSDFPISDASDSFTPDMINIFGIKGGKAGQLDTGFQNYASGLHKSKMAIGGMIGARNAVSFLTKLQPMIKTKGMLKNLESVVDHRTESWKFISKFLENGQNIVDIHGGKHEVYHSDVRDLAFDWIFYGKLPNTINIDKLKADPNFNKHLERGRSSGIFKDENFGNTLVERQIFKIMMKTMKGTNKVVNDTWDERGSRSPEPMEIRKAFYDIQNFIVDPNNYIANQLERKIQFENDFGNKNLSRKLLDEYMELFYDNKYYAETRDTDGKQQLIWNILSGKNRQQRKTVFNLKNVKAENPENAFDMHVGGHVLKELVRMNSFWEDNYAGIHVPDGIKDSNLYNAAGFFVKNVENFIEVSKMHGIDILAMDIGDIKLDITSFGNTSDSFQMKNALNNGILRELIHKQHRNLMNSLEYFSEERFVNPTKVEKLVSRITNLQTAMTLMDKLAARDMIIGQDKGEILSVPKDWDKPFKKQTFKNLKQNQRVAVYSLRGDIKAKVKDVISLFDHTIDNVQVDFNQLKFEGYYNNKGSIGTGTGYHKPGQPLRMQKGLTYYVEYNPKQRASLSDKEIIYSNALMKQTYNYNYDPEYFLGGRDTGDFRTAVRVLRAKIGLDYSSTIERSLSQRVLSVNLHAFNNAKTMNMITEFVKQWQSQIDPSTSDPVGSLLKYILRPQVQPTKYIQDHNGQQLPAYKTNIRLYKSIMQWAMDPMMNPDTFDGEGFARELTYNIEEIVAGRYEKPSGDAYDRAAFDKVDWSQLGDIADVVKSLAKYHNVFFDSPIMNQFIRQVQVRRSGNIQTIDNIDGTKTPIDVKPLDWKGKYNEILNSEKGC